MENEHDLNIGEKMEIYDSFLRDTKSVIQKLLNIYIAKGDYRYLKTASDLGLLLEEYKKDVAFVCEETTIDEDRKIVQTYLNSDGQMSYSLEEDVDGSLSWNSDEAKTVPLSHLEDYQINITKYSIGE